MRTAVIEQKTGLVVNVIERGVQPPNPRIVEATEPPEGFLWMEHETAGPGWKLVDGALQAPIVVVPEPTPQEKIARLEYTEGQGVYVRGVREFMLGVTEGLAAVNPQLSQQMLATPGMRKAKALDDKIKELRKQL